MLVSPFVSYYLALMSNSTHTPSESAQVTGPASFQTLSTIAVDLDASGLTRWLTQRPHQESWNTMNLRQDQLDFSMKNDRKRVALNTKTGEVAGVLSDN